MKNVRMHLFALAALFIVATVPNSALAQTVLQTGTWVHPASMSTNTTITVAENQIMEVLSVALDDSAGSIDITTGDATMTLGIGGNPVIPYPLVVAGPAIVTLKKASTGGRGSLLTYRLVDSGVPSGPRVGQAAR